MNIDAPSRASQPTAVTPDPTRSRYPGAPPFSDTELGRRLFYGRAAEAEYVLHSILSTDLFLLYGESGLGKTSLLNAGVLHELREHGFWPVSVRLNDTGKAPVASIRDQIEHAGREDVSVDVMMGDDGPDSVALWDMLASLEVWRRNELQHLVVVFDQFEELFTLDWSEDERARFIAEFGEVVRGHRTETAQLGAGLPRPDVRFVIVIREDALGLLEELSADVPQIMRNRFRLGPLDPGQAEAAIREPGRILDERLDSYPFEYTEAAIGEILEFLRTSSEHGRRRLAAGVDPSQLQIVCDYVERSIVRQKSTGRTDPTVVRIDSADLGGKAGLDRILSAFYRRSIEALPTEHRAPVQQLCERGLISPTERRLSLEQDAIADEFGVGASVLQSLVSARVLRAEPRVGSIYYELAHDTLVPAILADRAARRACARQRRRSLVAVAASVLGALLIAVAVASLVRADDAETDASAGDDGVRPFPLTLEGAPTAGDLVGTRSLFRIVDAATDRPVAVRVQPAAGVDVSLTVVDSVGRSLESDSRPDGGSEVVVVPPGARDARSLDVIVTRQGAASGSFTVAASTVEPMRLGPEDRVSGEIAGVDAVSAFNVDVGELAMVVGVVSPVGAESPPTVAIDVIAATRDVESSIVADLASATQLTFESSGSRLIVIRASDDSTGAFTISAEAVHPLAPGDGLSGVLAGGDDVALFDVSGIGTVDVLVTSTFPAVVIDADPEAAPEDPSALGALGTLGAHQLASFELDERSATLTVRPQSDIEPSDAEALAIPFDIRVRERVALGPDTSTSVDGFAVLDISVPELEALALSVDPPDQLAGLEVFEVLGPSPDTAGWLWPEWRVGSDPDPSIVLDTAGDHRILVVAGVPGAVDQSASIAFRPVQTLPLVDAAGSGAETSTFTDARRFYVEVTHGSPLVLSLRPEPERGSAVVAATELLWVDVTVEDLTSPVDRPPNFQTFYGDALGVTLGCGPDHAVGTTSLVRITVNSFQEGREGPSQDPYELLVKRWVPPTSPETPAGGCPAPPDTPVTGVVGPLVAQILTQSGASIEQARCVVERSLAPNPGAQLDILLALQEATNGDPSLQSGTILQALAEVGLVEAALDCGLDQPTITSAIRRAGNLLQVA